MSIPVKSFSATLLLSTAICSILSQAQAAQPAAQTPLTEVIVTATRAGGGIPRELLGSSVSVLEPADLEVRQVRVVSDVLRDIPGIAVSRSGTVGGLTQIRVRGTEGNHALVLIDGMEAADPYYGEFDFATLIADDVARIEVLRGQQSALYGSDAIGGVIHYMTASGRESPGLRTRVEGGSFNTWEGALRYAGASNTVDYAFSGGYQTTDGVATARGGRRELGSETGVFSGRAEFSPTDDVRVKAVARYSNTEAETNDQNFSAPFGVFPYGYVVDSDDYYDNSLLLGMVRAEFDSLNDRWLNAVTVQGGDAGRDGYSGGVRTYGNEGSRLKGSYESTLSFGTDMVKQTITGAIDFEREEAQNTGPGINAAQGIERQIDNTGLVGQYNIVIDDRIALGAALRHDENDRFDNADTYRLQGSYRFDGGFRIRAAAGSGIKNPSLTELFGFNPNTFLGNPNLKAERSEGWEVGLEQSFAEGKALVGAAYFDSTLEDEIFTIFTGSNFVASPANRTTDSKQKGIEAFVQTRIGVAWQLDASYTHLDAEEAQLEEVRRPPSVGSVNIGWRTPQDRGGLNLTVRYNGDQKDLNFTGVGPSRITLPAYTLVNLGGDWRINDTLQLYGRIENALDEEYEEVYTYRTPGTAAYLGVRASF